MEAMRHYIDNTTEVSLIDSACVLCAGNVLMVEYIWIKTQQYLEKIKQFLTKFYVIKMVNNRAMNLEQSYQQFKHHYYFQTKSMMVTSMIGHLSEIDTSMSSGSTINDDNIENIFVKQSGC